MVYNTFVKRWDLNRADQKSKRIQKVITVTCHGDEISTLENEEMR